MSKRKVKENISSKISTPVLLEQDIISNNVSEIFPNYVSFDAILERKEKMINATNATIQTVQPNANIVFTSSNVRTNACNSCCGWLNHNQNSGIFTITKPGIYIVHFNANIAPTVAGAMTLNISNAGESIAGGQMQAPGATVGVYDNVSAEVLVRVPCNSSTVITIKNNTLTNPITVDQPSLTITRKC